MESLHPSRPHLIPPLHHYLSPERPTVLTPPPTIARLPSLSPVGKSVSNATRKVSKLQPLRPRKSRRVFEFTEEQLSQYFHLSQKAAAERLGVAVITVKRNCKRLGLRWPYRDHQLRLRRQRPTHLPLTAAGAAFARLPLLCLEVQAADDEAEASTALVALADSGRQ